MTGSEGRLERFSVDTDYTTAEEYMLHSREAKGFVFGCSHSMSCTGEAEKVGRCKSKCNLQAP